MITSGDYVVLPVNHVISWNTFESEKNNGKKKSRNILCFVWSFPLTVDIVTGGFCFYIKTAINYSVCTDLNINNQENLCLEIRKRNSKPFVIVTWYRPPNSPNDTTSTPMDLIYTNYPDKVVCPGVCHVSISDQSHFCLSKVVDWSRFQKTIQ